MFRDLNSQAAVNPYAPPAATPPPAEGDEAASGAPPSVDQGPNPFLNLRELFFRPSRFFRRSWALSGRWSLALAIVLCGSDTFLRHMLYAPLKVSSFGYVLEGLLGDSFGDWALLLLVCAAAGLFYYWLGGWWWSLLLRLCGVGTVVAREARLLYLYSGLVAQVFLFSSRVAALLFPGSFEIDTVEYLIATTLFATLPIAWGHWSGYAAVRSRWNAKRLPAFLLFVLLPMLIWVLYASRLLFFVLQPSVLDQLPADLELPQSEP